jgi:hypothetical protein
MLNNGQGWHAFCEPRAEPPVGNVTDMSNVTGNASSPPALVSFLEGSGPGSSTTGLNILHAKLAALTSKQVVHQFKVAQKQGAEESNETAPWLCEAASEWLCRGRWESSYRDHMLYLDELARKAEEELTPIGLATLFLSILFIALSAVGCIIGLIIRQRRVRAHLIQVELELAALRAFAPALERNGDAFSGSAKMIAGSSATPPQELAQA